MSEVEAALMILSKDEEEVFSIISELITNNGYNYKRNGVQLLSDTYFDTKNDILMQNGIALRIRNINKQFFKITLKILQSSTEHYSKRIEIEEKYSKESLMQIIIKLYSYLNLSLPYFSLEPFDNPILNLKRLGFKIIQNKKTERKIMNAINKLTDHIDFEFVIDTTTYIFNNNYIIIKELEIESKHLKSDLVLNQFVKDLIIKGKQFRYWPYNKLLTGKVLEELQYNKDLEENKDYDDKKILTLAGIEKMELFIKKKDKINF